MLALALLTSAVVAGEVSDSMLSRAGCMPAKHVQEVPRLRTSVVFAQWSTVENAVIMSHHVYAYLGRLLYAFLLYLLVRGCWTVVEWLRVHYLLSKLPKGPPVDNIIAGNLKDSTAKGFHRWHTACANAFGGIWPNRVMWLHVRAIHNWTLSCHLSVLCMLISMRAHTLGLIQALTCSLCVQLVHVSDPYLCAEILKDPQFEKASLTYNNLSAVRHAIFSACMHACILDHAYHWRLQC
jgi:hypothetical protein